MYGITDKGFEIKRLDVILNEIYEDLSTGFGVDVGQNRSTLLNTLVTTFSNQIADLWETAQDSYYSKFPATATGINLDNAVQYGGIRREPNRKSMYMLHCTGDDGTMVNEGVVVSTNTSPEIRLQSTKAFSISRNEFHSVLISIVSTTEDAYEVTINDEQYIYRNTNLHATEKEIFSGISSSIRNSNYIITQKDELLCIEHTEKSGISKLSLSSNLTTVSVTTIAGFETQEYGKIMILRGVINKIIDNIPGFKAVSNILTPSLGRLRETDVELRQSYLAKSALRSIYMIDSIKSELIAAVPDIKYVSGHENYSDKTDEKGLPPHSIEIIVDGGDEKLIAETILRRKAAGIQTFGNSVVNILTEHGDTIPIRFNRPEYLYTWIKIVLHGKSGSIPQNFETLTKRTILEYSESMVTGTNLYVQKLMNGIYNSISGVEFVDVYTFFSTTLDDGGLKYSINANVTVSSRQIVMIDESRIEVETHDI